MDSHAAEPRSKFILDDGRREACVRLNDTNIHVLVFPGAAKVRREERSQELVSVRADDDLANATWEDAEWC